MNFSENLRKLRKAKDIKQETLAEAMNVSRQTVSKWENGTAMPDFKKLNALAEYFGVTIDELLGYKDGSTSEIATEKSDKEYINEILNLQNETMQNKIKSINKKWIAAFLVLLTATSIAIYTLADNYSNLNTNYNYLSNHIPTMIDIAIHNDKMDSSLKDYIDYSSLGFDSEKPWLANVEITYFAKTFKNDLKLTLEVTQADGKTKSYNFARKDDEFILDVQLDAIDETNCIIYAKDDATTKTADISDDIKSAIISCYFTANGLGAITRNSKNLVFYGTSQPEFSLNKNIKIKDGEIEFYFEQEKPFFTNKCSVVTDEFGTKCKIDDFSKEYGKKFFKKNAGKILCAKYTLTDENGTKYSTTECYGYEKSDYKFAYLTNSIEFTNHKSISYSDIDSYINSNGN